MSERWLTVAEVAAILCVSRSTVRRYIATNLLKPARKHLLAGQREWVISPEAVRRVQPWWQGGAQETEGEGT